ncbi:hypothetical protein GCM10010965_25310 [Caldalkalibacillus thermarum]|uniref:hypothetical protein n=1 Tax=Caldalkalibacillus thermarum TaxID=296745 RepID=UPI00166EF54C|nr:hypothetical protein [Caldalkalibacillus thermarum]GGK31461.1 hypothetical protein GCM10010965_25310 [Caldalkalibacillus thermarum]
MTTQATVQVKETYQMFIGGQFVDSESGATFNTYVDKVAFTGETLDLYTETKSVLSYIGPKPLNPFGV